MNLLELLNITTQFDDRIEVCVLDESESSECLLIPIKEIRMVEGRIAIVIDGE